MIEFIEDTNSGYLHRTYLNAKGADATLLFAVDNTTSGEKCTLTACSKYNKKAFAFDINDNGRLGESQQDKINECIKTLKEENLCNLNIAGNGMYTFGKHNIPQERVDELVYNFLKHLIDNGCTIKSVRSGGQTGADEAGLKAGERLGLKTVCLCPRTWRFRGASGIDIADKELFIKRFE